MPQTTRAGLREIALAALAKAKDSGDPEAAHSMADDALCALLRSLGFADVVAAYEAIEPRWCA